MSHGAKPALNVDVTRIESAETRRTLRAMTQQLHEIIGQQQTEIEALLQMITDKHIGSMGEFKRYVQRIAEHNSQRAERVHTQLTHAMKEQGPEKIMEVESDPEPERQVYRL